MRDERMIKRKRKEEYVCLYNNNKKGRERDRETERDGVAKMER